MVKFVGQRPQHELPYYYNAAELVVMPSHYESFSMTAAEAMACGVPVITTNVAGVSTLMDDQREALITSVNNPLLLAQKIEQLLFQPDVRQKLRGALRENVENLTWETTAERFDRHLPAVDHRSRRSVSEDIMTLLHLPSRHGGSAQRRLRQPRPHRRTAP